LLSSALLKSVFLNESLHLCCMHNHPCHFPCCLGTLRHLLTHYVITVVLSAMNVYGGNVFAHKNESCCELSRGSRVRMPLPVPWTVSDVPTVACQPNYKCYIVTKIKINAAV
jgi:hypothetical protein